MEQLTERKFYPLRPIQRWLIDTHFNKAKSTMMNIGGLYKLSAKMDLQRFTDALNEVLSLHDTFRCRLVFHPETSDMCQTFDGEVEPVKIEQMSDEEFSARMDKLREPYMLIDNRLWRVYVIETPTARYFYGDFYHAIMDGVSSAILFLSEVDKIYRGRKVKRPALSYAEYIDEESKFRPKNFPTRTITGKSCSRPSTRKNICRPWTWKASPRGLRAMSNTSSKISPKNFSVTPAAVKILSSSARQC